MWTALITALLAAVADYFKWQAAVARINARKLAYDIDQQCLQRGTNLEKQIDQARNAQDLDAVSRMLDDYQANALYAASIRSALPDGLGRLDVGVGLGVSKAATPGSGPGHGAKPAASTRPGDK